MYEWENLDKDLHISKVLETTMVTIKYLQSNYFQNVHDMFPSKATEPHHISLHFFYCPVSQLFGDSKTEKSIIFM